MYATTLEKKITRYLKRFGIKRAKVNNYFCYYSQDKTVNFTLLHYPEDDLLIDSIKEKYDLDVSPLFFIFALLHEVGHHVTLPLFSVKEYANDELLRSMVKMSDNRDNFYFNLPSEVAATEWALVYLTQNLEECWEFQNKCFKIIQHIYKKKSFPY